MLNNHIAKRVGKGRNNNWKKKLFVAIKRLDIIIYPGFGTFLMESFRFLSPFIRLYCAVPHNNIRGFRFFSCESSV